MGMVRPSFRHPFRFEARLTQADAADADFPSYSVQEKKKDREQAGKGAHIQNRKEKRRILRQCGSQLSAFPKCSG